MNYRETPASTVKPVRAIKEAITTRIPNPMTGQMDLSINTAGLIKAVSRERQIPRHSSIDSMLTGLSKPALERVLASVSA
jgi:hypothetical protein